MHQQIITIILSSEQELKKNRNSYETIIGIDTGIATTTTDNQSLNNDIYSIQGVKLNEAPAKGLYIQGGKLRMK